MSKRAVAVRVRLIVAVAASLTMLLLPPVVGASAPDRARPDWVTAPVRVYFPETGHNLAEPFLFFWRTNGGREVFGLPVSEPRVVGPAQLTVQYFERAVLEHRPSSGGAVALVVGRDAVTTSELNLRTGPGTAYPRVNTLEREKRVRLAGGPVRDADGTSWYQVSGTFGSGWSAGTFLQRKEDAITIATSPLDPNRPRVAEPPFQPLSPVVVGALGPDTSDFVYFPSTGHALAGPFKRFWTAQGGAVTFGLPLSEPFMERNPDNGCDYLTQYFERARLEYHPQLAGKKGEVQPAGLGRWAAIAAGVSMAPSPRTAGAPNYNPADFLGPKWIEVNLSEQRMTAWEGDTLALTTLIRSGKAGWETPPGTYRTFSKLRTDDMTLGQPGDPDYYYTKDVPWVMYFLEGGYAIHGAFWNDGWGTPTSHGCINTPLDFAQAFYEWAPLGTLVWVHF